MEGPMPHERGIRVLVAVRPHLAQAILEQLPERFLPTVCHSLEEATQALAREAFGMVLCSVQFDDNRLYDLLRHVRGTARTRTLPFIAAIMSHHAGDATLVDAAVKSLHLLGVDGCVRCADRPRRAGLGNARDQLQQALLRFC